MASGAFPHVAKDPVFLTTDSSALSESLTLSVSASLPCSSTSLSSDSSSAGASGDWETPFESSIDMCDGVDRSSESADADALCVGENATDPRWPRRRFRRRSHVLYLVEAI